MSDEDFNIEAVEMAIFDRLENTIRFEKFAITYDIPEVTLHPYYNT